MNKTHYQAVVIGGGVVGASVLYHLAKLGWSDVVLLERTELTAGSTWHAAAGFHALNADPNVAALQSYTINLYRELEAESGRSVGLHMTGGVNVAGTPERWEWLQSAWAVFQTVGIDTARLISAEEVKELVPIADITGIYGGLFDSNEGHLDASGVTSAYVAAARMRGAELVLHNRVVELHQRPRSAGGGWTVVTEHGTITADHVVNAAGLWAKQVGLMAGVDLPVTPMEHHYLVTEEIPEVAALTRELPMTVDLEGYTYMRQEGNGVLLGVYELKPKHWNLDGAPWDYGVELIPPDVDRIAPELAKGFERYPALDGVGIKKWVNGAFTFTPDGNPLVGPVPGLPGYWVACGVMAGFSQGGGVGLSLAEWMVHREPGRDVHGMDIARYGPYASNRNYLTALTGQFYKRRFVMSYPNEQLPAGRPLRVSALHADLDEQGARWGVSWGLETPLYFSTDADGAPDPDFVEAPSLHRSDAQRFVNAEVEATRTGVGLLDTTAFSRFLVSGPGAREWLDHLLANQIPAPGGIRLEPMLSPSGRLMGDLTLTCWAPDEFWVMGSYYLRAWHARWFEQSLAAGQWGGVMVRDISDDVAGVSLSGPYARDLLARVTSADVSDGGLRRMRATTLDVGLVRARVGRLSITGELGYELNARAGELRTLYRTLLDAASGLRTADGRPVPVRPIGYTTINALRLEKSYGIWSREFTWAYTPGMSGLDRFVAFDKPSFVGRDAALAERDKGAAQRLVTLQVGPGGLGAGRPSDELSAAGDPRDGQGGVAGQVLADASTFEPIWAGARRVGFVTSGAFGPHVGRSLALAYVDADLAQPGTALEIHVVGARTPATVIADSPYDPQALRARG